VGAASNLCDDPKQASTDNTHSWSVYPMVSMALGPDGGASDVVGLAIAGPLLPFLNWGRVCFALVRLRPRPASPSSGMGYTNPDFRLSTMEVPR
jgi:hypothetical protein